MNLGKAFAQQEKVDSSLWDDPISRERSYEGENYDRMIHAQMGNWTGWLSPATAVLSYFDWLSHLSMSPGKQMDVADKTLQNFSRFFLYAVESFREKLVNLV